MARYPTCDRCGGRVHVNPPDINGSDAHCTLCGATYLTPLEREHLDRVVADRANFTEVARGRRIRSPQSGSVRL